MSERILSFGGFQLVPARSLFLQNGRSVRLGGRALKILTVLVERAGTVVTKDELMAAAWPNLTVEEANIKVQLSALRKVLSDGSGERYITSLAGRGYCFTAAVSDTLAEPFMASAMAPKSHYELPCSINRLIGRAQIVDEVAQELSSQRLITLVGPGGIGKTTVALAVARLVLQRRRLDVCYVDLASLADHAPVPSAVAAALSMLSEDDDHTKSIILGLRDRSLLLVLDNCERLIGGVADLVERVLHGARGVAVLATSREPLQADGERIHRLEPLDVPDRVDLTASEALDYSAVQLFAERAEASHDAFELSDEVTPAIIEICQRLDGVPLAIEFAAAQVDHITVAGVARGLDDRFTLLTRGRRTALPRHQTLRATLDWSYDLLSPREQRALRRLGAFSGAFDLEAATAVAIDQDLSRGELLEAILGLHAKSMVGVDISGEAPRYRLLETTRAYAMERLRTCGEAEATVQRLSDYLCLTLSEYGADWLGEVTASRLQVFRDLIDDVRYALDWGFSARGDTQRALDLSVAAVPVWLDLSLLREARARFEQALHRIESIAAADPWRELALRSGLAIALFSLGADRDLTRTTLNHCLDLATRLEAKDYLLKIHWQTYGVEVVVGNGRAALDHAKAFGDLAGPCADPWVRAVHCRMLSVSQFLAGSLASALDNAQQALRLSPVRRGGPRSVTYHIDHESSSRANLCRTLWVMGRADEALAEARRSYDEVIALDHPQSICFSMTSGAAAVAIWAGDREAAGLYVDLLERTAVRHGFAFWGDWASRLQGAMAQTDWMRLASPAIPTPWRAPTRLHAMVLSSFNPGLVFPAMLEVLEREPQCVFSPEVLRAFGEQALSSGAFDAQDRAETLFARSAEMAAERGALSWELRTAISRARLLRSQRRPAEAHGVLAPILERFEQGFDTADYRQGLRLLDDLENRAPCPRRVDHLNF